MDNLNVYDVNDVNGMMKGMGKRKVMFVGAAALYLTATMGVIEHYAITPEAVGGVVQWTLFVEVPRVLLGLFLIKLLTGKCEVMK